MRGVMHMTEEFEFKLKKAIDAYERWVGNRKFSSCRLVHYAGVDRPNAVDVELDEVLNQISGCLAEGFYIDWYEQDSRLYLCVQEPDCPVPSWEKVVAEEAIEDVDQILREAGFDPNA